MLSQIMLIIVIGLAITLIYLSIVKQPRWMKVAHYVTDNMNMGMSITAIETGLMENYNLTPQQARLCVNNYGNIEWFEMQTFLNDKKTSV